MTYLLKADALGFNRVESTSMDSKRLEQYKAEGYREVDELEFTLARLVSTTNAKRILRLTTALAKEMGEEL